MSRSTLNLLMDHIPEGKENAVSRESLSIILSLPDRKVRKLIEEARNIGFLILNDQDGNGYYRSADPTDLIRQYKQDTRRALSILIRRRHIGIRLREVGVDLSEL